MLDLEMVVSRCGLTVACCGHKLSNIVSGGYVGDLLSDVIAHSTVSDIWITRQVHQNIIAVAALKEHAGIIIVQGAQPDRDTLTKAEQEGIPVMVTELSAFEIVGKIHQLLR
jgi:predicted transcriptional regulator